MFLAFESHHKAMGGTGADVFLRRRESLDSPWQPIEILTEVNSTFEDTGPIVTDDGLTLIFASNRPGGAGGNDLYVSRRASLAAPFGAPQNLGKHVNTSDTEGEQQLLADGKTLLFRRGNKRYYTYQSASTGVLTAIELTNCPGEYQHAWLSPDAHTVYFHSARPGGMGREDIWVSRRVPRGSVATTNGAQIATTTMPVSSADAATVAGGDWTPLFNGRDLTGWTQVGQQGWSVEDGAIVGRATSPSGWLKSDKTWRDFELEFEYRLTPESNSGVFLRAPAEGNISGKDFHEIQLLDDSAAKFAGIPATSKNGSLYNKLAAQTSKAPSPNEWHKMSIVVFGDRVQVQLNNEQALDGELPAGKPSEGHIGFQLYPNEMALRGIRLRRLSPDGKPLAPATSGDYALEFDGRSAHVSLPLGHDIDMPLTIEASFRCGPVSSACISNTEAAGMALGTNQGAPGVLIGRSVGGTAKYTQVRASEPLGNTKLRRVAAVYDGKKSRLFIDGKLAASADCEGTYHPSPQKFFIGGSPEGAGIDYPFTGVVDEVRFSKIARYTVDYTPVARLEADADTLALYHFDEGSGDVLRDASGNGRDGRIVGAKWVRGEGAPANVATAGVTADYAVDFSGINGAYLKGQSFDANRPLTMECVATPLSLPAQGDQWNSPVINAGWTQVKLFSRPLQGRHGYECILHHEDGSLTTIALGSATIGKRRHIAVSHDGREAFCFIDGKLVRREPIKSPLKNSTGCGVASYNAAATTGWGSFPGLVDEVRFSTVARYQADYLPQIRFEPDADTAVLFHFDEGAGETVRDSSKNGHVATIAGAKWLRADGTPLLPAGTTGGSRAAAEAPFANGDLTDWIGSPGNWKVEAGELVGTMTTNGEIFLAGRRMYRDFEASFDVRLSGNVNSGMQFRSGLVSETPPTLVGPQAEIGAGGKTGYAGLWWQGRSGDPGRVVQPVDPAVFQPLMKPDDYNRMTVRCVGKRLTITLNGTTTVDAEFADIPDDGLLGWQLVSKGGPAEVRFRNVQVRDLSAAPAAAATFQQVDLIELCDPARDRVAVPNYTAANNWTKKDGKLVYAHDGQSGKIVLPIDLADARDFEIECDFRRVAGTGPLTLDFAPAADKWAGLDVSVGNRIELKVEGNQRRQIATWPANSPDGGKLILRVRKGSASRPGGVTVSLNAAEIARWEGDVATIGGPPESHPQFPGTQNVGLFCYRTSYEIIGYKLRVFDGTVRTLDGGAALEGGASKPARTSGRLPPRISRWHSTASMPTSSCRRGSIRAIIRSRSKRGLGAIPRPIGKRSSSSSATRRWPASPSPTTPTVAAPRRISAGRSWSTRATTRRTPIAS
ncbi:MAG: DUF1080 domain-containing protein [Pirellulales bacterium]